MKKAIWFGLVFAAMALVAFALVATPGNITQAAQDSPAPKVTNIASLEMGAVESRCGKPSQVALRRESDAWYRELRFQATDGGTVAVTFSGDSRRGPWRYSGAIHYGGSGGILQKPESVLPCLAQAAGL